MDIANNKEELIEWLLNLDDEAKLKQIIDLKAAVEKNAVFGAVNSYSIAKKDIVNMLQECEEQIVFKKKLYTEDFEKEETIQVEVGNDSISARHKQELDKRLESYRRNPQDLLDWEAVKVAW